MSTRWSLLDQAAGVHALHCESLNRELPAPPETFDLDPHRTPDAVMAYGLAARRIYDGLKRVIGQTAGLLILAQASDRRDALDLPSLAAAEDTLEEVRERLGSLSAPGRLGPHKLGLDHATRLTASGLAALRALKRDGADFDLDPALDAVSQAYRQLQSASDSRFGLMMVDFRHACCTCGARQQ